MSVADVGDNTDNVVAIFIDDAHGIIEVTDKDQFRAHPHSEDYTHFVVGGFLCLCLAHDLGVEKGQVAGIILNRVLDDEDYPHVPELGISFQVDFVFQVFGHGEEHFRGAVPHEYPLDGFTDLFFRAQQVGEIGVVVDQHELADVGIKLFYVMAGEDRSSVRARLLPRLPRR